MRIADPGQGGGSNALLRWPLRSAVAAPGASGVAGNEVVRRAGAFSGEEVEAVHLLASAHPLQWGTLVTGIPSQRSTLISWIEPDAASDWLYRRIASVFEDVAYHLGIRVTAIADPLQYTVYRAGMHIDWHADSLRSGALVRKLSLSVQLSGPSEYEGGGLEFHADSPEVVLGRLRGTAIVFPSFCAHRVSRVTSGERRALVAWAYGPPYH
jgi:2OG-Fe(II) oxygenase superfamily